MIRLVQHRLAWHTFSLLSQTDENTQINNKCFHSFITFVVSLDKKKETTKMPAKNVFAGNISKPTRMTFISHLQPLRIPSLQSRHTYLSHPPRPSEPLSQAQFRFGWPTGMYRLLVLFDAPFLLPLRLFFCCCFFLSFRSIRQRSENSHWLHYACGIGIAKASSQHWMRAHKSRCALCIDGPG